MRLINLVFKDKNKIINDFERYQIKQNNGEKYFIQIFTPANQESSQDLIYLLNELLPGCEILLISSLNQIFDFHVTENEISLGISCFSHSEIKTAYFPPQDEAQIAKQISSTLISKKTKLLIIFLETSSVDGEELLREIYHLHHDLIVAGGKAIYTTSTNTTLIGNTQGVYSQGLVCASIDSDILNVQNSHIFGWKPVGLKFKVTKAHKNIIYELNNTPIKEFYHNYLGEEISENLQENGCYFPLVIEDDCGNLIGRAMGEVLDDGGMSFYIQIPEGSEVRFSFGLLENIKRDLEFEEKNRSKKTQATYMYSCTGRIMFLGLEGVNELLSAFSGESAICGFFTNGEIYHFENSNCLLNLTSTQIALSEEKLECFFTEEQPKQSWSKESKILNSVAHLLKVTSEELHVAEKSMRSYRELLDKTTTLIEIDKYLNISYINDKASSISNRPKEQVVGQNVVNFLNKEMAVHLLNNVVPTLKKNGTWSGKMSHLRTDGTLYYVTAFIKAIFDRNGEVLRYIMGEIDITDEMLKQEELQKNLTSLQNSEEEKRHFRKQYEEIAEKNQILFRLDIDRNFIYANETFLEIASLEAKKIIGKNFYEFLDESQSQTFYQIGQSLVETGAYDGILNYVRPDGQSFYIKSNAVYIRNLQNEPIEIMAVGTDITQIIEFQKEIEKVQQDVIIAMGTICEGKSRETGNHIKRVAKYSKLLAKLYGCTQEDQKLIEIASPMHDIGKIGIPDTILSKPDKLTPEEYEIMKTHTTLGADMLQNSNRKILKTAAEIARSHHEWWAGGGYPNNLKGEEIPLFGRITAITDVFDAISNDRCYKKAWLMPDVITYIRGLKGKQFEPKLVDLMLGNIDQFLSISKSYKD